MVAPGFAFGRFAVPNDRRWRRTVVFRQRAVENVEPVCRNPAGESGER
jgi:hypothetical protein